MRGRSDNGISGNGFTLVETLVAVTIIAIVVVSVFRLQTQSISMNIAAQFHTVAPMLAQKKMTEIALKPVDEWIDDQGDFGDEFPEYSWNAVISEIDSEYLDFYASDMKKIAIQVSYNDETFSYDIATYRFAPQ